MVNIICGEVGGDKSWGGGRFLFWSVLLWSNFDTEYNITTNTEIWEVVKYVGGHVGGEEGRGWEMI